MHQRTAVAIMIERRPILTRLRLVASMALLALGANAAAAEVEAGPAPLPGMGPVQRPLQLEGGNRGGAAERHVDRTQEAALAADVQALKAMRARVEQALRQTRDHAADSHSEGHAENTEAHGEHTGGHETHGETSSAHGDGEATTVHSKSFAERLLAKRSADGAVTITATLEHEPLDAVYRELLAIAGKRGEELTLTRTRTPVALLVTDLPWADALDRVLGQAGLGWRLDGVGEHAVVAVVERDGGGETDADAAASARALERAAASDEPAAAAEALYLLAARTSAASHPLAAIDGYNAVIDRFGDSRDDTVQSYVLLAVRGVGEALNALDRPLDALAVFKTYIGRAARLDTRALAEVMLECARTGRRIGAASNDAIAFDEAIDQLHLLLEKFAPNPEAATVVVAARLELGELLYDAGRYREAETQLTLTKAEAGAPDDRLRFRLAECAFHLDRVDEARTAYEELRRTWNAKRADPAVPPTLYATAGLRIGQCYGRGQPPRFVHALFAFIRARQEFPQQKLEPDQLIAIARAYAELERDEEAVAALWELLKSEAVSGGGGDKKNQAAARDGAVQLDQLIGELQGRLLADYGGPVRAKVLFGIAQAQYARAERATSERAALAALAVGSYERVLGEDPPPGLRDAARLGLARAALIAEQSERGVETLRQLLRDPDLSPRDRAVAGQVLGSWLKDQGRLREAVSAFRGEDPK